MTKVTDKKTTLKDELYGQYNWFHQAFLQSIQAAGRDYFGDNFSFQLMSVSKNINVLFQGDDYFVTKIRIDKQYDAFFRFSSDAVKIILDKTLGESKKFNLSNLSQLEVKIISSFNDYFYTIISRFLQPIPTKREGNVTKVQKRKNFDVINLTFFIRDQYEDSGAKIIVSLPQVLLAPKEFKPEKENFDISDFKTSKIEANIKVGTTKFSVKDLKNLEKEDIVVFETSDITSMQLIYKDFKKDFKINPNPALMTSTNNNGGNNMEESSLSKDLWDNIQVEMGAEFEKIKITLGELKNIEQGLVVDISSIYDNKISLKVENKLIAKGELVIINDRYGVRIDEVVASESSETPAVYEAPFEEETSIPEIEPATEDNNSDEEFDYSDFELDDEDI